MLIAMLVSIYKKPVRNFRCRFQCTR